MIILVIVLLSIFGVIGYCVYKLTNMFSKALNGMLDYCEKNNIDAENMTSEQKEEMQKHINKLLKGK